MAEYFLDNVVHYGAFKKILDQVVDIMRTECASSVVIRGNPGTGKRTLVDEAVKVAKVKCVHLSSHFSTDDYSAIKAIATQLGFQARGKHIADLMQEIKGTTQRKEKLVIILADFEDFCRQRQSLLYNLMNLIHTDPNQIDKSPNLTLIGMTPSMDWAENIEKRVRSRLNAKCIDFTFPYSSSDEFVEFTSLLLNGYKIDENLREHLEYIYEFVPNPSPRVLKKYLSNMLYLDGKGKVKLDFDPESWNDDYQINMNNLLRERLRHLNRQQLDLLKLAVNFCYVFNRTFFTLNDLSDTASNKSYKSFMLTNTLTLCDVSILLRLKLVKPAKRDQSVNQESVFYPAVTSRQFKAVISGAVDLHSIQTDSLWRSLK